MKKIVVSLLSLMLLFIFSACGSLPPENSAQPTPTAEPTPTTEPTAEPTVEPSPELSASPEEEEVSSFALEFADVYFHGTAEEIRPWLTEDYQWGVDTYESEAPTDITLQYVSPADESGDTWAASIRFRMGGEDSYTYLVMDMTRAVDGWKVSFYGLDK